MTAEPLRDPAAEPEKPASDAVDEAPAPATDEAQGTVSEAVVSEAAADQAAAVQAADDQAAADQAVKAQAATGQAAAAQAGGLEVGAVDAPVETPAATPAADATTAVEAPAVAVEEPAQQTKVSRRPVILAGLRRLVTFLLAIALFVGGIALGTTTFQRTRAVPVGVDGAITVSDPPPAVTEEFIRALAANDADAMRSSLNAQSNKDLTDEFARFSIKRITSVEVLGTHVAGTRSATEILMRAEKTDGLPFEVNLVILVDGGQIEGFR